MNNMKHRFKIKEPSTDTSTWNLSAFRKWSTLPTPSTSPPPRSPRSWPTPAAGCWSGRPCPWTRLTTLPGARTRCSPSDTRWWSDVGPPGSCRSSCHPRFSAAAAAAGRGSVGSTPAGCWWTRRKSRSVSASPRGCRETTACLCCCCPWTANPENDVGKKTDSLNLMKFGTIFFRSVCELNNDVTEKNDCLMKFGTN